MHCIHQYERIRNEPKSEFKWIQCGSMDLHQYEWCSSGCYSNTVIAIYLSSHLLKSLALLRLTRTMSTGPVVRSCSFSRCPKCACTAITLSAFTSWPRFTWKNRSLSNSSANCSTGELYICRWPSNVIKKVTPSSEYAKAISGTLMNWYELPFLTRHRFFFRWKLRAMSLMSGAWFSLLSVSCSSLSLPSC